MDYFGKSPGISKWIISTKRMWNQPTDFPFSPHRQDDQRSCCLRLDSDETSLYRKHMYLNFPTKATVSTPTKRYGLWQRLQDPNQGLNTQPNVQIFLCIMKLEGASTLFFSLLM